MFELGKASSRKDQEQYWAGKEKPYNYISVSEFAEKFKRFDVGLHLENQLSVPFDRKTSHKATIVFTDTTVSFSELLRISFAKEWLLLKWNSAIHIFETVQVFMHYY